MNIGRRGLLSLALLCLVVIAGCQSPIGSSGAEGTTIDASTTTEQTPTEPTNPWNQETLTVAVTTEIDDRNYSALTRPAIEYWNDHRTDVGLASYAEPPRLELTTNTESADVVIHYKPTIARCNGETTNRETGFYHCGPAVTSNTTVSGQLEYAVTSQFTNQTTTDATINALAGLYGVADREEPRSIDSPRLLDPFPRTDTVTIGIDYIANDGRNITPLVQDAVDYWMANDDQYGDYTTDWVVKPDAQYPDVVVLYVDTIIACGFGPNQDYYIGCTNLLSTGTSANTPVHVEIAAGYTDNSTTTTIKHEFGHLYGLVHGEEPMPLMSATGDAVPLNETNGENSS